MLNLLSYYLFMMSPLASKCYTDTSVLPPDILSLQGYDFFKIIERLTSDTISDLLRIQAVRNVRVFMLVPDLLAILKAESGELDHIKNQTCIRLKNNNYFIKPGIEASLRYLRELFATKIQEHYCPNNQNDTSTSSDDNVPIGQKRAASLPSSEQVANKRGRK